MRVKCAVAHAREIFKEIVRRPENIKLELIANRPPGKNCEDKMALS